MGTQQYLNDFLQGFMFSKDVVQSKSEQTLSTNSSEIKMCLTLLHEILQHFTVRLGNLMDRNVLALTCQLLDVAYNHPYVQKICSECVNNMGRKHNDKLGFSSKLSTVFVMFVMSCF